MTCRTSSLAIALRMFYALAELSYFEFLNHVLLPFASKPDHRLFLLCRMPGILFSLFSTFSSFRTQTSFTLAWVKFPSSVFLWYLVFTYLHHSNATTNNKIATLTWCILCDHYKHFIHVNSIVTTTSCGRY